MRFECFELEIVLTVLPAMYFELKKSFI